MAISAKEIGPFGFKKPAPFKLGIPNLNGAAFYINAIFITDRPPPICPTEALIVYRTTYCFRKLRNRGIPCGQ